MALGCSMSGSARRFKYFPRRAYYLDICRIPRILTHMKKIRTKTKPAKGQSTKAPDIPTTARQVAAFADDVRRHRDVAVADDARYRRDVALARERIGTTIDDRCRWLLDDFAVRDPDALSTGERAVLRDNLHALAEGMKPRGIPEWAFPIDATGCSLPDPPDADLRGVWERAVALTRAHVQPADLPGVPEELWTRWRPTSGKRSIRLERHRDWPDLTTALLHQVADLLAACERLRECPECHRLFVARRRQERHPKCARQARDSRRPSRQKKGA